jgi:hypothetical protein
MSATDHVSPSRVVATHHDVDGSFACACCGCLARLFQINIVRGHKSINEKDNEEAKRRKAVRSANFQLLFVISLALMDLGGDIAVVSTVQYR